MSRARNLVAWRLALCLGLGAGSLGLVPVTAQAQTAGTAADTRHGFSVAAGSLSQALNAFAASAGIELTVDAVLLQGKQSPGLAGSYSIDEGFAALLQGHGLLAVRQANGSYTLVVSGDGEADVALPQTMIQSSVAATGNLPPAYAGGQVASGSRVGLLGNKDFMETPFNTVAYTEEYVQNRQAQDIGAVIGATDPSVYVPSKRSNYETFFIRGFSTTANDITFNGLIGMAPNMRGSTELAERVEVLKGPSALLNGMPPDGSVAGSINIVPKRAGDEPLARLTTTYESRGLGGVHADVGQRFGEQKQFGVRFNGVYRDGDTAVDDQQHKMELSSLAMDWRGERARLSADLYKQRERMDGVNYFGISSIANTVNRVPTPKKGNHSLAPEWGYTVNDTETLVLRGEFDLSEAITAYGAWGQRDGGYDALMTRDMLLNDAGDIDATAIRSARDGTQKSGEIGLKGHFATGPVNHAWSLAASRFSSKNSFKDAAFFGHARTNYYNLDFGPAPDLSGFGATTSKTEAKLGSYALVDTLSFAEDRVQWTVGARQQNVQSSNYGRTGAKTASYDESRLSPATALLVKVTDNVSVYANYIEGLSQGASAPDTAANAGDIMKPFQTKQYEVGSKLDLGYLATTLSLFQIEKPSAYTDPVTNLFGVYGEQRNRGVEWNFFGEVQPGLRLLGGASYTKAELTKARIADNEGNQVTGVPKVLAKLGTEYDLDSITGLTLTGNLSYTGERYVTDDHRLSLPSYTTFDLGTRYTTRIATKPVTLRATLQNVANKAYWLGSWSGGDGSGLSGGLGAPRTLLMSASVDF
ncbi:TonB-dependent receptor [Pseudomonas rubra]|uniref:TonB-dependent receptor n=1 Tax=Pseudomonas rubra TaxID=2942627 RepID=A0ABT5PDL2_9PSED|nr:TonB-dependent receptor [Pseudomonas rubra]MDD1016389.1 TonB-dependent receptor [Pseudomonas rubra]MDD1036518.1 TonB-dependent receptor [Pseudomonas rubra]MDD1156570.1 TonB-dependent receptor [Pseudomonas rubra]